MAFTEGEMESWWNQVAVAKADDAGAAKERLALPRFNFREMAGVIDLGATAESSFRFPVIMLAKGRGTHPSPAEALRTEAEIIFGCRLLCRKDQSGDHPTTERKQETRNPKKDHPFVGPRFPGLLASCFIISTKYGR